MKRFIMGMMSMIMLVGCAGPNAAATQIRGMGKETFRQGLTYDTRQEDVILLSDLEKEFQNNNMNLIKVTHPDALTGQYNLHDDGVNITVLVDELTSQDHHFVRNISIEPRDNYIHLSEHPAVKAIASVMGEEQLLTWVAEREGEITEAGKNNENIEDVLAMDRCYLYFVYRPGRDTGRLEFSWAFKPSISPVFEEIALELEENGMLITGYIAGPGGETLTATTRYYYVLKKMGHSVDKKVREDIDQAGAYQVMHDKNKPGSYSVQLHGYMSRDLSYPAKVEAMPGIDKITQLMGMEQDELVVITDEINKELTEAKRIRNNVYKGEYYLEGAVGEYRYIITVPQGMEVYSFTVLIEKI